MKKMIMLCFYLSLILNLNSRTLLVTNIGNGFSPQVSVAAVGDTINFQLAGVHNAIEVNRTSWDSNQNQPLAGGFMVPFGGGKVVLNSAGEKYFICSNHVSLGMKGMIIVMSKNTLAYTGFEGASTEWLGTGLGSMVTANTFQILKGDTTSGIDDEPSKSRIFDGLRSWQVNDFADTIILSPINTTGYDSLNLKFRFTATSTNPGQGVDDNDNISVFISLNGAAFKPVPTLIIRGDNNNTWGFDADSIIQVHADSFSTYSYPSGFVDTLNTASAAIISIPFATVQVRVMFVMNNNQNKEVWNMDAVTLCGVKSRALPIQYQFLALERTNLKNVKISWTFSIDSECNFQYVQRSETGTKFTDIYQVKCKNKASSEPIQFIDIDPYQGLNYYRIKSVYFNGDIEYSEVKSVDMYSKTNQMKLYPTVAREYIRLISSKPNEERQLQIVSINGTILPYDIKSNLEYYYIGHLPNGVYKITCRTKQGLEVLSFVKF